LLPKNNPEHVHAGIYHIVLFTEGRNYFRFRGRFCAVQPGTLALVSPGEPHNFLTFSRPGKTVYSEIVFGFADAAGQPLNIPFHQLLALYEGIDLPNVKFPVVLSPRKAKTVHAALAEIVAQLTICRQAGKLELARQILGLFALIIRECYLPQAAIKAEAQPPIQRARDYIETHYTQRLKIRELAGMVGMSVGYFFRSFKKEFGQTPIVFQQNLRVKAAMTLLRYTHLRCKEIAGKTGYENIYYFFRTFKKIAGISPMAYRAIKPRRRPAPES
jgi:AraC-like DNA-binding protein